MAAKTKTAWVAFKSATPVPGTVLGEVKDRRMKIGEAIQLPAAYAAQMVENGFATAADAPNASPAKAGKSAAKKPAAAKADAGADTASSPAQGTLNVGGAQAVTVEAAQAKVDAITAEIETLTEDQPRWQELQPHLDDAVSALAQAQDAAKGSS